MNEQAFPVFETGDDSGRGSILTAEGQATLSMAKSVLTALVESISNASVTVEVLRLLQKYKQRFLDLLRTNSTAAAYPVTNGSPEALMDVEVEQSLNERIEEIQEFQAFKVKVASFINMCNLILPGKMVYHGRPKCKLNIVMVQFCTF